MMSVIMNKRFQEFIPICFGLCCVCVFLGYGIGLYQSRRDWEVGAVKAGHGEWITDEYGWSTFRWRTNVIPITTSENE